MHAPLRRGLAVLSTIGLSALLGSCGGGDDAADESSAPVPTRTPADVGSAPNACPAEGCRVRITSATPSGDEIRLDFDPNFTPDMSRNHFHVFWDVYSAKQVSDDAEPRFGVTQGEWVPTADNPFTTTEAVSVKARKESTKLCVTAGDRDHKVLDPEAVDCRDVSSLL